MVEERPSPSTGTLSVGSAHAEEAKRTAAILRRPLSRRFAIRGGPGWKQGLRPYVLQPERYPSAVEYYTDECVVVKDKYAKVSWRLVCLLLTSLMW